MNGRLTRRDLLGGTSATLAMATMFYALFGANGLLSLYDKHKIAQTSFNKQMDGLNETEKNLKELLVFVELQKTSIAQTQSTLQYLNDEHDKLLPLVNADRQAVEALLAAQDQRNSSKMKTERIVSFILGVVASLVASVVYAIASRFRWRRKLDKLQSEN